jgi:uncharacterized membrane protein
MKKDVLQFKSSRSWLLISIVYIMLSAGIAIVWLVPYYGSLIPQISITTLLGIIIGLFTWAVCSTYYLLGDDFMVSVSGPIRMRVFYRDITEVRKSKSAWSSLALSFDRVAIICEKNILKTNFVSPKLKEKFIQELKARVEEYKNRTKKIKNK